MYERELQKSGLSKPEARVYYVLILESGITASSILKKVNDKIEKELRGRCMGDECKKLSRQGIYKIVDNLVDMNLAEKKIEKKKKTLFYALTPKNLEEKLKEDKIRLENSQFALNNIVDELDNTFNVNSNKPGVRFLKGRDDNNDIYEDMLKAEDVIYTYIDPTRDVKNEGTKKHSQYYENQRRKFGIKKKAIIFNNKNSKKLIDLYNTDVTEIRIMKKKEKEKIPTIMHIYNGKIVYINIIDDEKSIAFIVKDKYIYDMNRKIFESQWDLLSDTPFDN